MSIIFRYSHIPRLDGVLKRAPFIPVHIKTKYGQLTEHLALLDSGADMTVVPKELAELFGLKESPHQGTTGGIGGSIAVKESKLIMTVKGNREQYSMTLPCLVVQDPKSDVPFLLGRNGFFEKFHITFKQNEEKILLKKIQQKLS